MPIFEFFPGEDQTLLTRWNAFLVLDLCLYVLNGVVWLHIELDRLSSQSLASETHAEVQDQEQGLFLLVLEVSVGGDLPSKCDLNRLDTVLEASADRVLFAQCDLNGSSTLNA